MTHEEMLQRGWDEVDVVFVTGDAYVDHPGFAAGLLGRVLEADGFRVGILAQPDWKSATPWKIFGRPKLAFCISAGNMDSMINHYTANRKIRSEDAYSPGGEIGKRPDRATLAYSQRAREAYPGCVVVAGGVEASLRRLSHYDYWSDKVKRSILLDSKADLLVYGMGETPLLEILRRLRDGENVATIRDVRGTAWRLGQTEDLPEETETTIHLPSHEEVEEDKQQFSKMTRLIYRNLNPYLNVTLVQEHAREAVVVNPLSLPLSESEMDRVHGLPFTRQAHPSYGMHGKKIPALEVVKNSVQIHRGCFGGCTFCALAAHQGKLIQSRSADSIVSEITNLAGTQGVRVVSDLGGPSANMYKLGCKNEDAQNICRRTSCLVPDVCPNLNTDHGELVKLMKRVRGIPDVEKVLVASGVRTDLALHDPSYIDELVRHHTGGHLKTAPEHTDPNVLRLMNKPTIESYDSFCALFADIGTKSGKEQYLVPYFIAGFPGSTLSMMVETAVYLKRHNIKPEQVQEFIPGPFTWATSIYYTGIDPSNGQPIYVPRKLRERRLQKALLLYDAPDNYHDVKSALKEAGREDLIGTGPGCLIAPYPPKADSMRRSSRVKRLQRQNERDKTLKEKRRADFEEARIEEERKERDAKRAKFARHPSTPRHDSRRRDEPRRGKEAETDRPPRERGAKKPFKQSKPFKKTTGKRAFRKPFQKDNRNENRPPDIRRD